ncbi:hypothetical protein KSX_26130 [Ktedonospora formicarum]|uniref:Tyr recombinase domain-containing protein n=2 Tax=Ktedonospora formicarum TaxID=2778364 RepID=A0A8J3MTJ7_9CHLR|nr:hypothetical protein KSX_26130 [Ktedonospora formicarum]
MPACCNPDTSMGFRDYVIILLLLDTGIRVGELCGLTLDTVFLSIADQVFVKVLGKGRHQREVGLISEVAQQLWKYVNVHRHPRDQDVKAVFLSRNGEPLTINGIQQLVQEAGKRANIKGARVSPHTFRHTFARMFLENGGDVYKLSVLLGHSSVVVIENYLKDFESRSARRVQSKHSPIAHLKLGRPKGNFKKSSTDMLDE